MGGTPYNGLYGGAPPKRLQVYEWVGVSKVEVYERVEESVLSVRKKAYEG